MASRRNTSAPQAVSPISSTSHEDSTASTNSTRSSFFRNRFSSASLLSLSSVRTALPHYSAVDTLEGPEPPASPEVSTENHESLSCAPSPAIEPPRYSFLQHRQSLVLTRRASTATCFGVEPEGEPQTHIQPKNPWATLHLHTRDGIPGNSDSLQNQPRVPRLWSCDLVTGAVQFGEPTEHPTIVLSSHTGGPLPFLKREFTIWDTSMNDPLYSDSTDSNGIQKKKIDTRLVAGQHVFPFSFPFPTQTDTVLNDHSISPFPRHTVSTSLNYLQLPIHTTPFPKR